jgi:hypothetical protein
LASGENLSGADEEKTNEIVFMGVTRLREIMKVRLVQLVLISFEEQTIMELLSVSLGKMHRIYSSRIMKRNKLCTF